jgi:hypothetical protein
MQVVPDSGAHSNSGGEKVLIEKEVIRPGCYWYTDQDTGLPRKLDVTPELCKYWLEQGNAMLSAGLTVPVPCEHDFNAHPMTPAEKLKSNAGWVKEYRLKDGALFGALDIQDDEVRKKLPGTIRWTSPWINSFTDGAGRKWNNVISHLALTTRPRIIEQQPFGSVAAALSMATTIRTQGNATTLPETTAGYCLSNAGRLFVGKKTKRLRARFPLAFSMYAGGIKLAEDDLPPPKKKKNGNGADDEAEDFDGDLPEEELFTPDSDPTTNDSTIDLAPFNDPAGDVTMEELLCDLLNALGVQMPDNVGEAEFKRTLYDATMAKIKELSAKGLAGKEDETTQLNKDANNAAANTTSPGGNNPLIQQEQQPMYMSLDDINKITDSTMRTIALSMYNENVRLRSEMETARKTTDSLRDAKLKEATAARANRVAMLSRLSPKVKADLDAMIGQPAMALSMGDGGTVIDPMAQTLAILEKGLADMPRLLTTDSSALAVQAQPTDADMLSEERANSLADTLARQMGCTPKKASA